MKQAPEGEFSRKKLFPNLMKFNNKYLMSDLIESIYIVNQESFANIIENKCECQVFWFSLQLFLLFSWFLILYCITKNGIIEWNEQMLF